jgi:UDP-N-acetylglucosamine 2-epimerase (non-hydrolysing)/GDP/UDP-N,N'-diacetylbacillosamine 2-epimerase (hydrolysing)
LKICAVTGSRADWGHLAVPLAVLRDSPAFELRIAVTGQHLTEDAGGSLQLIEEEGFRVDARIDLELDDDTPRDITKAIGRGVIGFADALAVIKPDLLLVLGDRYEILAAVQAALIARIPVAHISGGDVSEGALDESIRHAITKMAHIHFVTNADSARRVCQLGEDPLHVHVVGSPALDRLRLAPRMTRAEFFEAVGLRPRLKNLLITFHPVTLEEDSEQQCAEMIAALADLGHDCGLILTGANYDAAGRAINAQLLAFSKSRANAVMHSSLGSVRYISALANVDLVLGNSSSGLCEAPSFRIPTVNIGTRQKGRLRASSVLDCDPDRRSIRAAIDRAFELDCSDVENPYGDGYSAERIARHLAAVSNPQGLLKKHFHDIHYGA